MRNLLHHSGKNRNVMILKTVSKKRTGAQRIELKSIRKRQEHSLMYGGNTVISPAPVLTLIIQRRNLSSED